MKYTPQEHHQLIIDHLVNNERAAVFAGMGLGKTGSTLYAINELLFRGKTRGVLIISPCRVTKLTWPMEIEKWNMSRNLKVCHLRDALIRPRNKKKKADQKIAIDQWVKGTADIYLVNYELLMPLCDKLMSGRVSIPCDMVVFDELSMAKNAGSKRINKFRRYTQHFERRVGLTGTPTPNSYIDLFAQIRVLDDGKALDHRKTYYESKYFWNPDKQGFKWVLREGCREKIEDAISHLTITLSSEDWLDIPEVEYKDIELKFTPDARRQYNKLEKEFLIQLQDGEVPAVSAAALTNKLQQLTSGTVYDEEGVERELHDLKIKALKKEITAIRKSGEQGGILVACLYKHEVSRILEAIPEAEKFDDERLGAWNAGEIPVWVSDFRSISHGLNLQEGGSNVIWFSIPYSYEGYDQFNARLARTGQEHRTTIRRLIMMDSIDEAVTEALRFKEEGQSGLMSALKVLERLRT